MTERTVGRLSLIAIVILLGLGAYFMFGVRITGEDEPAEPPAIEAEPEGPQL